MAHADSTGNKPTISAAMRDFGAEWDRIMQRCIGGFVQFSGLDDFPPFHQVQAYCILSTINRDEEEVGIDLDTTVYYLREADKALDVAKKTYVHEPYDAITLLKLEAHLKKEWQKFRRTWRDTEGEKYRDGDEKRWSDEGIEQRRKEEEDREECAKKVKQEREMKRAAQGDEGFVDFSGLQDLFED